MPLSFILGSDILVWDDFTKAFLLATIAQVQMEPLSISYSMATRALCHSSVNIWHAAHVAML